MIMKTTLLLSYVFALICLAMLPMAAYADTPESSLPDIQQMWAHITFELPKDNRDAAYTALETRIATLISQYPQRAEPKIWQAITLSTHASQRGGLGALSMVKKARDLLLEAQQIDPLAMKGSIYTTLGCLYYQVPGWPIGFGDKDKARVMLQKALEIDPEGINPNYFYGDFLYRSGNRVAALAALSKALAAPPRPDQSVADKGRREQVEALIKTIRSHD
jgi:tetratricopeptide (TPR) repeat protein